MKHSYEIKLSLRYQGELTTDAMLRELQQFSNSLLALSPNLSAWLLWGDTEDEALLYEVFKDGQPTTAAKAVTDTRLKGKVDPRSIVIWNGKDGHEGASLQFIGRPKEHLSLISFDGYPKSFSPDWSKVAEVLKAAVSIWGPSYITVDSDGYYEHKVFKDRPGVGWMLYLPHVLTVQQVPEARALVPVMGKDEKGKDKQIGTIIVSVTDEPFSDENPEHVKIANAIEVRLVDQDLLPRFADL